MFITELFAIVKTHKKSKCSSMNGQRKWDYIMKYYSDIRKLLSFVTTCMNLEYIVLSEANQRQMLYSMTYM